jgi:hypothetical protein
LSARTLNLPEIKDPTVIKVIVMAYDLNVPTDHGKSPVFYLHQDFLHGLMGQSPSGTIGFVMLGVNGKQTVAPQHPMNFSVQLISVRHQMQHVVSQDCVDGSGFQINLQVSVWVLSRLSWKLGIPS